MILSFSQVNTWKACTFRWWLRYRARLESTKRSVPLTIGTVGHAMIHNAIIAEWDLPLSFIEVGWPDADLLEHMGEDEYTKVAEFYEDAPYIIRHVLDDFEGWDFTHLETSVTSKRRPDLGLADSLYMGYVDAIVKDPDGYFWIVDWKLRGTFAGPEEWNPQMSMYRRMVKDTLDIDVQGTIIYEIKPYLPAYPKLNKNGTMSRSACKTDWETYRRCLIDANLDPSKYDDMRIKLEGREFRRSNRHYCELETSDVVIDTAITPYAKQIMMDDSSGMTINEAAKVHGLQYGFMCKQCEFKPICTNIPYGLDSNEATSLGFKLRGR